MRIFWTLFLALLPLLAAPAYAGSRADAIVLAAAERTTFAVRYDPKYVPIAYPGGDVAADTGVCTDVIIRTYRAAFNFDFQQAVHEDMRTNFSAYPKIWGLKKPDANIDHRRVPNLEAFLTRQGASLPVSDDPKDYLPGDLVTWRLGGRIAHIGIVSNNKTADGKPLIIHNIGKGPVEENLLLALPTYKHFRFVPRTDAPSS